MHTDEASWATLDPCRSVRSVVETNFHNLWKVPLMNSGGIIYKGRNLKLVVSADLSTPGSLAHRAAGNTYCQPHSGLADGYFCWSP